jgi:hypothetical protein
MPRSKADDLVTLSSSVSDGLAGLLLFAASGVYETAMANLYCIPFIAESDGATGTCVSRP